MAWKTYMDAKELEEAGAYNLQGHALVLGEGGFAIYTYDGRDREVTVKGFKVNAQIYKLAKSEVKEGAEAAAASLSKFRGPRP